MNKYITELIGAFFLVMGAILGGAVGASLALMIMVYAGGHVSGGHYNPAVTLSVWMRGKIEMKDAVMYWIFQFAGALIAALIVMYVFSNEGSGECRATEGWGTKAIIAEMLGTFALAYVVLNVATARGTSGNSFYGIAIGGTVLAMATAVGSFSGGAFNPAVAIGLCMQHSFCWDHSWVYFVGDLGGGALAAIAFSFINPDDK
ncbi:MAG: aquaporin [Ferruginibacter sp.]|nr:aquaporin [Chitinophagaceae bacterium]MBP6285723.1 aquaporin [Ferruginibacter sp.]